MNTQDRTALWMLRYGYVPGLGMNENDRNRCMQALRLTPPPFDAHAAFCEDLNAIVDPVERGWALRIACEPAANNTRMQRYAERKWWQSAADTTLNIAAAFDKFREWFQQEKA